MLKHDSRDFISLRLTSAYFRPIILSLSLCLPTSLTLDPIISPKPSFKNNQQMIFNQVKALIKFFDSGKFDDSQKKDCGD